MSNIALDNLDQPKVKVCSICGADYEGWGNNGWPVNEGRCCDHCNGVVVIPARLAQLSKPRDATLEECMRLAKLAFDSGWDGSAKLLTDHLVEQGIGSYAAWARMARNPLVWLGQPDPVISMETARDEDPELSDIREFFDLWVAYLDLDQDYTTARIIEIACATPAPNDFNPPTFKQFLLRVAAESDAVSAKRLGWWLRRISGRVVNDYRLLMGRLDRSRACFRLQKTA
jgi:hypothetical protein